MRIRSASICGSDLKLTQLGPLENTLGHELAGVLDDDSAVAIEPFEPCGACDRCDANQYHLCTETGHSLMGIATDGGMAEEVRVAERSLVALPSAVDVADACLTEPLGVAIHGLRIAGATGGQRVGVIGAGSVGLAAVAAAIDLGCDVELAARHPHQVAAGEALGATPAEGDYDLVVEAAGSDTAMEEAVSRARPGATIAILGTHFGTLAINGTTALIRELKFVAPFAYNRHAGGRDIDAAAALLAVRPEIAEVLITHRFSLDDAAEAFRVAADKSEGSIKVVLEP